MNSKTKCKQWKIVYSLVRFKQGKKLAQLMRGTAAQEISHQAGNQVKIDIHNWIMQTFLPTNPQEEWEFIWTLVWGSVDYICNIKIKLRRYIAS